WPSVWTTSSPTTTPSSRSSCASTVSTTLSLSKWRNRSSHCVDCSKSASSSPLCLPRQTGMIGLPNNSRTSLTTQNYCRRSAKKRGSHQKGKKLRRLEGRKPMSEERTAQEQSQETTELSEEKSLLDTIIDKGRIGRDEEQREQSRRQIATLVEEVMQG